MNAPNEHRFHIRSRLTVIPKSRCSCRTGERVGLNLFAPYIIYVYSHLCMCVCACVVYVTLSVCLLTSEIIAEQRVGTKMDYPACNGILVEIYLRSKWRNRNHFCAKGRRNVFVIRAWYLLIPKFRSDSIIRESISRRLNDSCKKKKKKQHKGTSPAINRYAWTIF